jgi:hypothetical protein
MLVRFGRTLGIIGVLVSSASNPQNDAPQESTCSARYKHARSKSVAMLQRTVSHTSRFKPNSVGLTNGTRQLGEGSNGSSTNVDLNSRTASILQLSVHNAFEAATQHVSSIHQAAGASSSVGEASIAQLSHNLTSSVEHIKGSSQLTWKRKSTVGGTNAKSAAKGQSGSRQKVVAGRNVKTFAERQSGYRQKTIGGKSMKAHAKQRQKGEQTLGSRSKLAPHRGSRKDAKRIIPLEERDTTYLWFFVFVVGLCLFKEYGASCCGRREYIPLASAESIASKRTTQNEFQEELENLPVKLDGKALASLEEVGPVVALGILQVLKKHGDSVDDPSAYVSRAVANEKRNLDVARRSRRVRI